MLRCHRGKSHSSRCGDAESDTEAGLQDLMVGVPLASLLLVWTLTTDHPQTKQESATKSTRK